MKKTKEQRRDEFIRRQRAQLRLVVVTKKPKKARVKKNPVLSREENGKLATLALRGKLHAPNGVKPNKKWRTQDGTPSGEAVLPDAPSKARGSRKRRAEAEGEASKDASEEGVVA